MAARHECGLFAAISLNGRENVLPIVVNALRGLQHRGQDSAGVVLRHPGGRLTRMTNLGLVPDLAARLPRIGDVAAAIGHVRYATFGSRGQEGAQPVLADANPDIGPLAFAFAGHVADLAAEPDGDWPSDATMLADRLLRSSRYMDLPSATRELLDDVDGAINLLALTGTGQFLAARDKHGFRPLHWGVADDMLFVSSEDHVLRGLGCRSRELEAGGLVTVRDGKVGVEATGRRRPAACSFEFVYFAHSAASFEHRTVQGARERFGFLLAEEETSPTDNAVVIPIPASGAVAGRAFAQRLGLPVQEGIVTDRYHDRTFIGRHDLAGHRVAKHHVVPDCALGRDAFLVDDSMVRGATLQRLVGAFRRVARPRSVHVRLAAPPVLHPCFYGIDIPDRDELFAARLHLEDERTRAVGLAKLAAALGVDTVRFISIGAFRRALAPGEDRFCYACLTGDYPTPAGTRLAEGSVAVGSRCG